MDLHYSKEDLEFRQSARDWLHANVPREPRPRDGQEMADFDMAWQQTQYAGGWAGIAWPAEFGGRGLSLVKQMIWHEEAVLAGAPRIGVGFVGMNHAGPTLIARGTDEQKAKYLQPILAGNAVWCQGFSEPNAGSDLAGLRTSAVIDGDHLVVNGQKIWTSYAQFAQFQELLVRTDPGSSKHRGISWVVCDMSLPGIEVRPLKCMNGTYHFNEVFYTDVRIPLANLVGDLDDGWRVTLTTLDIERGTAFTLDLVELTGKMDELIEFARGFRRNSTGRLAMEDETIADQLMQLRAEITALKALNYAIISRVQKYQKSGPEGSVVRLYLTRLQQKLFTLAMDLLDSESMKFSVLREDWVERYLWFFSCTIAGGTTEIQREIIAEKMLGLPRGR